MKAEVMKLMVVREKEVSYRMSDMNADNAHEVAKIIRTVFRTDNLPEEHMFVISMDIRNHINGIFDMAHGQIDSCTVNIGDILKRVLITNGQRFIMYTIIRQEMPHHQTLI